MNTSIRIAVREVDTLDALRPVLQFKLMLFGTLCATSALGPRAPEGFEPVTALFDSVRTSGDRIEWSLPEWPAGEQSLPVLASLYAAADVASAIAKIEIMANRHAATEALRYDDRAGRQYPPVTPDVPFAWRIVNEGQEDICLSLRLAHAPGESERKSIQHQLTLWGHAASMGAYGVAPVDPLRCSFLFDEFVEVFDERLVWNLRRFRAHPDALDSLVNVCAGLHGRVCTVLECIID